MKKIKIFDIYLTPYELFVILMGGVLIGAFIRLIAHYFMRDFLAVMQISIVFFSSGIICILFRIGNIVHGKETDRMLKEMKQLTDKTIVMIREENEECMLRWQSQLNEEPKESPKNE